MTSVTLEMRDHRVFGPVALSVHQLHDASAVAFMLGEVMHSRAVKFGEELPTPEEIMAGTVDLDEERAEGMTIDADRVKALLCEIASD